MHCFCAPRPLPYDYQSVPKLVFPGGALIGDIVKVTPTSKVVGDMAIFMVANDLTADDVANPDKDIAFPESVISLFKGELGFPPEGFPKALEVKVLKGESPLAGRAGDYLSPVDLDAARKELEPRTPGTICTRRRPSNGTCTTGWSPATTC